MELHTLQYNMDNGWPMEPFPQIDSDKTLILIFAAPEFINHSKPIEELSQRYPQSKMIGCSTAGEIYGSYINDRSLSVAFVKFDKTPLKVIDTEISSPENSFLAGEQIATQLNQENLRGIFVLSDGLKVNGSELVKGLNTVKKEGVVITGGLAGDGKNFKQTWVVCNGKLHQNHIVAVGFYDQYIQIGHSSRGGWDIFGPERRITKSNHNILYELDGKPALTLYKEYLGERATGLPATGLLYPLAIRKDTGDSRQLVRTILGIDEKEQSLKFAGDVPTGYLAQLMRANFDRLITSATEASDEALKRMSSVNSNDNQPVLAVAVSCVGRRLLLGERTEEETASTLSALPQNSKQVGFYSYGELSPFATGACDLHNQTMTLTTFAEK